MGVIVASELDLEERFLECLNRSEVTTYTMQKADGDATKLKLVPRDCPNAQRALFQTVHRRNGHRGRRHTLADIWKEYFLEGGNRTGIEVIRNCLTCAEILAPNPHPSPPRRYGNQDNTCQGNLPHDLRRSIYVTQSSCIEYLAHVQTGGWLDLHDHRMPQITSSAI